MGYYSPELQELVENAKWNHVAQDELDEYIQKNPSEWEAYQEEEEESRQKAEDDDDDFKPGSDMHTWATTRFF
ncbi:MAG: hypothetical protein ACRC1D_10060 [Culicoidibacterales bacterium]